MVKTFSNLFIKTHKKESKCQGIINTLSQIGKTVHLKDNSKSVPFQNLRNKLSLKLLVEFSLKNQLKIKINDKKMMNFE